MGLFTLAWNSVLEIGKLIALPVTKARGSRRFSQVLRWTLHVMAVATILACLGWLNYVLDLEQVLRTPWHRVGRVWLPLMFGLIYTLAWLGWWLWRMYASPRSASSHPDIDDAWNEAMTALDQAGIDIAATPVFLVLGRPAASDACLFQAAGAEFTVPQTPRRRDAPLHLYANDDAVFITCAGASLLGRQAEMYAAAAAAKPADKQTAKVAKTAEEDDSLSWESATFEPAVPWSPDSEDGLQQLEQGVALLVKEAQSATKLAGPEPTPQEAAAHASVLAEGNEAAHCTDRLMHLCQLLTDVRRPFCPINAVVALMPWAATDSDADANNLAAVVERDLEVVHETLALDCPLLTIVCDLEQAVGCQQFIEHMPDEQRRRRLGVTLPHLAACDQHALPAMIADGLRWLCQDLTPSLCYRMTPSPRTADDDGRELAGNIQRYRFLSQLRQRETRLARIVTRGTHTESATWRLRGCYLAATGASATRDQAFVAGIFPQLLQLQNSVAWTPSALRDDRLYRRWTMIGYATLALFTAVTLTMLLSN